MRREYPMTWLPLESKMFFSVAYDADTRTLYLRFRSGDVYRYFHFSEDEYQQFLRAESKGRHFLQQHSELLSLRAPDQAPSRLIKADRTIRLLGNVR